MLVDHDGASDTAAAVFERDFAVHAFFDEVSGNGKSEAGTVAS